MGDGSMTTLTIADPTKSGITQYLKSLPSRNPEKVCKELYLATLWTSTRNEAEVHGRNIYDNENDFLILRLTAPALRNVHE